jgi:hypothetical protein
MEFTQTMPELGFDQRAGENAFASNVLESLDDIYNSRNVRFFLFRSSRLC